MNMPRRLGQHFLTRGGIIHKILMSLQLRTTDRVLEIGPGRGALTQPLASKVERLLLVEKDPQLVDALSKKFSAQANVTLLCGDFLELEWRQITELIGQDFKVVSNLPYQVGTPILIKLLMHLRPGTTMILMFQKEVGDRLLAEPRSKAYGSLTIFTRLFSKLRLLAEVSPRAFTPPPKVHSSVLLFHVRDRPLIDLEDLKAFESLMHSGFQQRRKMLRQNLKASFAGEAASEIEKRLQSVGASPQARAEELSVEQWLSLFHQWKQRGYRYH